MPELSSYAAVTDLVGTERIPVITTPGVAGGNKYITATNLAASAPFGGGAPVAGVFSLADYGAVGDGVADDSHAIRDWCLAAAAIAGPTTPVAMYAPPGTYKTTLTGATFGVAEWGVTEAVVGVIPSYARVYGVPQRTWFYPTGVPAVAGGVNDHDCYMLLGVADGSSNIVIEDLAFRGENTSFVYVFNNQAACIDIMLSTTHDITIRTCAFRDIYGFSIHDRGENENIHVKDCWFYQCSNGLNVNANGTIQTGNIMDTCEGIECSGSPAVIDGNIIINAQSTGISMGGASEARYGVVVTNNVVDGSTGAGMRFGDGNFGSIIDGNFIRKTRNQGLSFGEAFPPWGPVNCVISNNTFVDCGLISAGAGIGMEINTDNHVVTGNICYNTGTDVLYQQDYACLVRGDNCFISGNYLDGVSRDLEIANTAANTRVGSNFYVNNLILWGSGGTSSLAVDSQWFKATTDKVREHRISGGSTGEPYSRFAEYADGKLEWGGAAAARDTNLYRSAANVLKTDDTFAAALGVLLTEQSAPSAPATNNVILYAVDNGSGKTKLMALFPTGAAVQVAIEP